MLGRNLIYVMSGAFLLSVPKFRAASKISDLLTSGDPDIKLICINCMSVNKGVHKEQNEWSFVKLFQIFPELLHFTFPLPLNMASEFRISTHRPTFKCDFLPFSCGSQLGFKVFL